MPTYLYLCPTHGEFEEEHSIKIKLEFCPKCKEETNKDVEIKRLINCVSKGVVELYGHDLVEKCRTDAQKMKTDAAKNANVYANLIGESKYHDLQTRMDRRNK